MEKLYIGIDFHKNKTVLYTTNHNGEAVSGEPKLKTINTTKLIEYFSNKGCCEIAIEATGGVNPYAEKIMSQGHKVHIINPSKFRGIGVSGKKTDERDAKALNTFLRLNPDSDCEVHLRSKSSRDIKSLVVSREITIRSRVNITNHIRGMLRENQITIPQGAANFWKAAPIAIQGLENPYIRTALQSLLKQATELKEIELGLHAQLVEIGNSLEMAKKLRSIPGLGVLTAVTMLAITDDVSRFPDADKFASYLGLVPRVSSSADTTMMGSITRSGSEILRRYLIHGARAWLTKKTQGQQDPVRLWALEVEKRRGTNKATVALARKMSRIAFALLRDDTTYREFSFENKVEKVG